MPTVIIRRAEADDCRRMLELVQELATYEKAPEAVTVTYDHFRESGFGTNPVWWAFVAEEKGIVLGFALYYIRYSTWKGQKMYLEDIIVTESARGRGLGRMLMEQLVVEAKERKLQGICWQVLDWNEPAFNFYRKFNARFEGEWVNGLLDL